MDSDVSQTPTGRTRAPKLIDSESSLTFFLLAIAKILDASGAIWALSCLTTVIPMVGTNMELLVCLVFRGSKRLIWPLTVLNLVKASNPVLRAALEKYHREGITNDIKISERLRKEHSLELGYSVKITSMSNSHPIFSEHSVKRRRRELGFVAGRYTASGLTYEEMAQYVLDVLDEDKTDSWGVENVKARIAFKHAVHIPRHIVSDIMHIYAPDGFAKREPGAKRIVRVQKAPLGIHERWAADGHDKLYSIGFPVWAIVDDATGKWLGAWVVPSNRLAQIVAYLFLDTVERFDGE